MTIPTTTLESVYQNVTTETTLFTANEVSIDEFVLVEVIVSKNSSADINIDLFVNDGSNINYLLENYRLQDEGNNAVRLPVMQIPLSLNDFVVARPVNTGDFDVHLTIAKRVN